MEVTRLLRLAIPEGWIMVKNDLADEDPVIENGKIVNESNYSEDILSIERAVWRDEHWVSDPTNLCLDVGWLPEGDPNGSFRLTFLRTRWADVLFTLDSTDRHQIRRAIERCLWYGTVGLDDAAISERLSSEFGHDPRQT